MPSAETFTRGAAAILFTCELLSSRNGWAVQKPRLFLAGQALSLSTPRPALHFANDPGLGEGPTLHLLFICTGNVCRSPIAERLAVAYGGQIGLADFKASSAGTHALTASPIHRDAALALGKLGGEASNFSARRLTPTIAYDADLILTMTKAHREAVLALAPRQLQYTFTLAEAARLASQPDLRHIDDMATLRPHLSLNDLVDINDPIGQRQEFFTEIGSQIADLLMPILALCLRLTTAP